MPVYEYKGQHYDLSTTDPAEAKAKILRYLGQQTAPAAPAAAAQAAPQAAPVASTEPPPSGLSGEFAGFADVFAQPAAGPAAVAPARAQPKPYRNRQEALNDAVNMLEEGADQNQVIQSFKGIGVNWNEIIKRGKDRSSPYFREQYVTPEEAARNRAAPRTDTATITGREPGYLEGTANLFKRADTRFGDMATGFLFSTGAFDADQAAFSLREAARQRSAAAPSTAIQQGMEAIGSAKTYGEAAEAMLRNPRATFTMLAESLLVTAPTLAATIATAPAGAAVRAGMTFAGSGAMEYTSVMADVLQDKGIDLMDPAKVSMALRDPKVLDEIKEKGAKRGLIVGAFDALSMGLAGRFMQPANDLIAAGKLTGSAAKKATVAAWGKELALQMGAGAGGEFAAQKATGEDRPADVLLEALAEGVSAPIDVYSSLRNLPPSAAAQLARAIEEDSEQAGVTPEGLRMRSALEAAQPPRSRVEPRLQPGALPVPAEERREPSVPEDMVVPGMPTGDELEELAPPAPPAAAAPVEEAPAAPVAPAAPPAAPVKPTIAAAALPETPTVPPATKPREFEPTPEQQALGGLPIQEVPISSLKLSKDVPQFKVGASDKGVVEPLGGKFERTGVAPIQVWRRLDGSLEIISGRHRFDLAQRSGEKTIPAQVHDESQGFNADKAAVLDAELNIRDGQGKVKDYVNYFQGSKIPREEANARGLLARALGKRAYSIAADGSEELIAAVRSDQIGDEAAYYIALNAPKDSRLQAVGLNAINDGKSMNTAINMMQAVKALASEQDTTTDMFGFDDSAIREAEEMAKIAARKQRDIQTRLSAISGAAKNPALAKAEGIDIKNPEAVKKRIDELRQAKAAWENWSTSPGLVAEIRAERGTAPPTLAPAEPVIAAQTEEELRQKTEREAEAERRQREEKAGAERKAKANAERDEFVLTGSDRAADEAAARGQADIFGKPEAEQVKYKEAGSGDARLRFEHDGKKFSLSTDGDKPQVVVFDPAEPAQPYSVFYEEGRQFDNRRGVYSFEELASKYPALDKAVVKALQGWLSSEPTNLNQNGQKVADAANKPQGAPAEEAPPAVAPKAANPIKALEQSGFVRVPNGNLKQYVDKGGQPYLTMERGPVRIALQPSELLFVDKKAVIKGMDEDAFTLAALLVEPDARGQGLARKALQDVIKTTDSFDKDLYLEPTPLDDQPMSQEQLIKFYKSVGFEFQPNSNNKVMVRKAGATVPAETVAKAPAEEPAKPIGAAVMGQRQINAADRFRKAAMSQFKLTQEQADAAMGRLIKDKVLILDPVTGQFELKDGRFWDREVLLKAAGEKPVKIEEPKEVAAARKEMKKVKPGEVITPAELARRKKLIEYEKKQKGKEYEAAGAVVVNDKTPSADLPASKRLVIMPCCDMKGAEKAPAMELYKGVFFQTFRSNAQEGGRPNVVILSAKHGFIAPTKEIEPYDQMMTSSRSDEMLVDLPGLISNLQIPEGIEDVLIVGGKDYQRVMKAAVAELQKDGTISENASVNATSGGIGDQRKQLGEYLRSIPSAEAKPVEKPDAAQEDKENAEVHAKEVGGEIAWQKSKYALVRGYSVLTGDPVYVPTMGSSRARVDIEGFTGAQVPEDVKQEMIAAKKKAEAEAQKAHEKKPFIKFKDGVAVSEGISPELEGVIRGWKDLLKLDVPIYVGTIEDARRNKSNYTGPHRRIGSGTLDANERGSVRRMSDGSYYILFKESTSPTLMLETIAHEMGHLHERLVYEKASPEEKRALADAHAKWLENQKGKSAQDLVNALRGRATQRQTKMPKDLSAEQLNYYWKSFGEWYADQVSRWAMSGTVPVGVVEKFFKRLGNQLRRFFQSLKSAKYLPDETFVQYIEKATARPVNLAPDEQDISDRMVEGDLPAGKVDVLENIEPKNKAEQIGFSFDTQAADEVSRNNPTVAQTLARANQLPGAKKKLPPGRSPELAAAAEQVQAGLMTAKEFDELVNRYKPIPVYFAPLKPATQQEVYNALDSAKREKIDPNISTGYPVGLRLDIPAFNRHGVFVVSIHEKRTPSSPGKVIGYNSVASIKDVTFGVGNQKEALRIATGEAKDAIQTMEGKYNPITPEQAYQIADDAILSGDWVQVGFDPTRHAYFFDRRTTVPVVAAEEVIQIGNMILAKGVTYGKKDEFLYNIGSNQKQEEYFGDKSLREYQIERYAGLRRKIAATLKKVAKGDINIDMQRNLTRMMQDSRELQAEIKSSAPRRDSAERFMAKALEEYDKGNIDAEVLAVVEQVYQKSPELLEGLLLSVKKGGGYTAGSFGSISRIITLFKETSGVYSPVTIRHELSHSLEQMMTPEQASVVIQAWTKALARAIKQNPDARHQKYFNAILDFIENPTNATLKKAQAALPSYEMYQFINPSEYWAVNAERLLGAELGPVWGRFKKAVRKLFEAIKNIFGFDNTYAIHKVFDQVMGGKKERITNRVIAEMITGVEGEFTTLKNIEDEKELMEKYSRPKTPMLDQTPTKTFITRQFKNGKEFFSDAAKNPKEAMVGSGNAVMDGLIYMRNKNVWYGSGLEARDFDRYNGELRTSEGMATASVALDNAIRSGNIGVEVIFRGGIAYDRDKNNFVAVERRLGMKGVYEAEAAIKARLGDQLGTDIVQGYLEAKRSISIKDELYEREAALEDAKQNLEAMRALRRPPEEIAQAQALVDDLKSDVEAIKKAVSSVNMSEEEMGEFAALDEKHPELKDLMRNWTAVNQNLLKFWRQVGLLSAGRYEKLSAIKDYVPWYRIMNDELDLHDSDQSAVQSTTRSMTNIGREKLFKRGRPISVVDFRAKEGQQDFKIQPSSVVKVKVNGQAVDPSRVSVTSSGEVRIDMPLEENDLVVFETNREIENIIDNMTRNVMRMTMNGIRQFAANRIVLEYASRNENGKIMVFPKVDKNKGRFNWMVNGKKVVVEIQDPLVAASIYGMENLNLQMWAPLAAVANFTRRTITLSGIFQLKQVFKDAPTAALVTGVKNPLALIGGAWKGFLTSLVQPIGKKVGVDIEPVVDILKAAGIGGYMSPARTPEAEIKRRLGIMNRNVFDFVIKGLDHIGDASDMAQRVATYKRVLAETGNETQALYQAANVINFLHHGSAGYAQAIVKTVPFMGAYANATDVLVRALVGGGLKGVSRKRALARLSMTMAVLSSLTLLYAMLAGGDPEYDELDDQTKLRNIIIPGTKIMLPMNTSAAYFFKAIPELIYNQVTREGTENEMDRKRLRKALADAARDMLLGPEPIPAGVKPLLEVAINHSFFTGRPVIPEGMKDLEAAEQYTAATSELGKKMSAMLEIPGTDGKRVISPIQADHLIRGIFGTAGAMGQWVSNSIGAMAETRPAPTDRETPITGSFLRPEIPRGREDLFYDFKERVDKKYATYMKMVEREDDQAADAYLEKHGDLVGMKDYITETEEELKEINAEIRRIGTTRSKDMSPEERRREMDDYQRLKLEILEPVKEMRREAFGTGLVAK